LTKRRSGDWVGVVALLTKVLPVILALGTFWNSLLPDVWCAAAADSAIHSCCAGGHDSIGKTGDEIPAHPPHECHHDFCHVHPAWIVSLNVPVVHAPRLRGILRPMNDLVPDSPVDEIEHPPCWG
jgi:hypothetical protein